MSVKTATPTAKAEVKAALMKLFDDLGFNTSDLDAGEAAQVNNKRETACTNAANTIVESVVKIFTSSKDIVKTVGTATAQQSLPDPTASKGIIFGE